MQAAVDLIQTPERAAILMQPNRLRILATLSEPGSAASAARALGWPRQRVSYHVRELERHGYLRQVGERRKRNCVERLMQATARRYLVSPQALGMLGLTPDEVEDRFSSAYLIAVASQMGRDVAELEASARGAGKRLATLTLESEVRFASPEDQQAFATDVTEAVKKIVAKYHDDQTAGGRRFRVVLGAHPAVPPLEKGNAHEQ